MSLLNVTGRAGLVSPDAVAADWVCDAAGGVWPHPRLRADIDNAIARPLTPNPLTLSQLPTPKRVQKRWELGRASASWELGVDKLRSPRGFHAGLAIAATAT